MKIYVMSLEPLETRYTGQWHKGFPLLIAEEALQRRVDVEVIAVDGEQVSFEPTPGAFLDFGGTNIWKNTQINELARAFATGEVKSGDKIVFTDAWHTGILQVRYMSELLGIPVEIHSMWHAGSYDPQDFLGRLIRDKRWTYNTERALFYASTYNYFATEFHRDMFLNTLFMGKPVERGDAEHKCVISGQPHNILIASLERWAGTPKRNLVLFPHRVAPEKQVEIFRDLALHMPDAEFVVCQDQKLTKDEYHTLLAEAKIVFSANLQETLGISAMEGILVDTYPFLPDRLSYSEMYLPEFKYPSEWTESFSSYEQHRKELIFEMRLVLNNFDAMRSAVDEQKEILLEKYLHPGPMLDRLFNGA